MAAVFTNGLLRIVRASDAMLIRELWLNIADSKITKAQIASKSFVHNVGEMHPEKTISLAISFQIDNKSGISYSCQVFSLKFTNLTGHPYELTNKPHESDQVDLGLSVEAQDTGCLSSKDEITSIYFNNQTGSFWIATQDAQKRS